MEMVFEITEEIRQFRICEDTNMQLSLCAIGLLEQAKQELLKTIMERADYTSVVRNIGEEE